MNECEQARQIEILSRLVYVQEELIVILKKNTALMEKELERLREHVDKMGATVAHIVEARE